MYLRFVILMVALTLTGCGSLQKNSLAETSDALLERATQAMLRIGLRQGPDYRAELAELFGQPYIDPLTRYLEDHADDNSRQPVLVEVRRERELRCQAVAKRYLGDPISAGALARYKGGYSFSCPDGVQAYAARLERLEAEETARAERAAREAEAARVEEPQAEPANVFSERQLNDCYVLTEIRNLNKALKACQGPAEAGDVQSQTNMAHISHVFQDHAQAYQWAREAAPKSDEAAYLLGKLYEAGLGVAQNPERAAFWYGKAAERGHSGARTALDQRTAAVPVDFSASTEGQ